LALSPEDIEHLELAYRLAEKGRGRTSPNPLVGAVITLDGRVIGQGHHAGAGHDHAEVAAIKDALARVAREELAAATIYVTLEPCCHYGRTPPCTEALKDIGFKRVVVGASDPSRNVNGQGLAELRQAGMVVQQADGSVELRFKRQNSGFRKAVVTGLPFVIYKYAMSLDGRVATDTGDSRWISGKTSREMVHRLRSWADAVMVGSGTVAKDDPRLTARDMPCTRQPLRVVIDPRLSLHSDSALVKTIADGPVLVVCLPTIARSRQEEVRSWGVEVAVVRADEEGCPAPSEVVAYLGKRGVQTVLLEGGPTLAGAWFAAGLIDRVLAFVSPQLVSGSVCRSPLRGVGSRFMADAGQVHEVEFEVSGEDVLVSGYLTEPY
jgi:diaminohydroxyphosphoribosylaminopyrimidine deaminase / 5-amino-6-(5-phosphoribosylamino)uracil reductase